MGKSLLDIEVAYALPDRQRLISMQVPMGTTALEALRRSGLQNEFPEIRPESAEMGVFARPLDGKANPLPADYILRPGDRVEVYRPLLLNPNEARRFRAARAGLKRVPVRSKR